MMTTSPRPPVRRSPGTCTADTLRCDDALDYKSALRPCCRSHVVRIMGEVVDRLTAVGATWWADYGTLLGAIRNPITSMEDYPWLPQDERSHERLAPGIIPNDKDADVSVLQHDWPSVKKALLELKRLGRNVIANDSTHTIKVRLSDRNSTHVDLFFWRDNRKGQYFRDYYAKVDRFKGREIPYDLLFPLSTVEWEGMTLAAPANPRSFLVMRYGENWARPIAAADDGVRR